MVLSLKSAAIVGRWARLIGQFARNPSILAVPSGKYRKTKEQDRQAFLLLGIRRSYLWATLSPRLPFPRSRLLQFDSFQSSRTVGGICVVAALCHLESSVCGLALRPPGVSLTWSRGVAGQRGKGEFEGDADSLEGKSGCPCGAQVPGAQISSDISA